MRRMSFVAVALLALGLSLATASASASTTRSLLNQANVALNGSSTGDGAGYSVSSAGDVNGDGHDDVIIGAPYAGNNSRTSSGSSYVIYGQTSATDVDLSLLTPGQGFQIDGAVAGDFSGFSVSGAGDVNGDGRDDVVVGAQYSANNSRTDSGSSYVIYGQASAVDLDLLSLAPSQGLRIDGAAASDQSGSSVSGAGDVNGDGRDDVIIGAQLSANNSRTASGSSYVIYGQASAVDLDLLSLAPSQGFQIDGAAAGDQSGSSVSGAGDVNGDGRDDVIVGVPYASNNSAIYSGSSYVIYGQASATDVDLSLITQSQGFRINGSADFDKSSYSVSRAGDVNGDGRDDVIVGAPYAGTPGHYPGSSYVIYGQASATDVELSLLTPSRGFQIEGAASDDLSGYSVSGAGDVNGDGRSDVIVGARGADSNSFTDSGSSYVIYGKGSGSNIQLLSLTPSQGFRIDGAAAGDVSGSSVSGAGDVNGDGRDDVIVGAPWADNNSRLYSGSGYLLYSDFLPWISYNDLSVQAGQTVSLAPTLFEAIAPFGFTSTPLLPAGLSIDQATGVISGTPTKPGVGKYEVTLNDSLGITARKVEIKVTAAPRAKITSVRMSGPSSVRQGRTATFRVVIKNGGNATASGVRLRGSGRGIAINRPVGQIAAGKGRTVRLGVRFRKPGRVRVAIRVFSANAGSRAVAKTVRVRR